MGKETLTINYERRAASSGPLDLLYIEQEPWAPYVGLVTKANMVKFLARQIYGEHYQEDIDCGMGEGGKNFVAVVHAYPLTPNLQFKIHTTYGTLSEGVIEDYEHEEQVGIVFEKEMELEHAAQSVSKIEWLGGVYDRQGNQVPPPGITATGKKLTVSGTVCGTVKLTYMVRRHTYILNIDKREDAIESFYSAAVYGVYNGGIAWEEIEAPPGAEEFAPDPDAVCGWTYKLTSKHNKKPYKPPKPEQQRKSQTINFCTGKVY